MKNQLKIFENEEFGKVRVLEIDGQPWFVGKDVTNILGYSNSRDALSKRVDAEDKGVANCDTLGGEQKLAVINESGLYSLILSSKLPSARRFKHWVTSEVLPSIHKHGAYLTDEALEQMLQSPELAFQLFQELLEEKGKASALIDKVETLAPKARYYDLVLQSKDTVQVSVIAKDYGMTAVAFNRLLHALRIQYKIGGTWLLYQRFADHGYTRSRTYYTHGGSCAVHTYWTQKGRLFLYQALAEAGILPLMEAEPPVI